MPLAKQGQQGLQVTRDPPLSSPCHVYVYTGHLTGSPSHMQDYLCIMPVQAMKNALATGKLSNVPNSLNRKNFGHTSGTWL